MQYCQQKNIEGVTVNDIYVGNGVSELIMMALQALLENGDEILIPAPDYPFGLQPPIWPAACRFITFVMNSPTGIRILRI